MYSTITGPSLIERCSELPCMQWPLWPLPRLQQLRVVLVPILLLVGKRWREQQGRVWQQRQAEMVASRFVRGLHA